MHRISIPLLILAISGCSNNPYRQSDVNRRVRYATVRENPKSLDPSFAYDTLSLSILGPVCEPLLQYHYLARPYKLVPALAEEMPRVSLYTYREKLPNGRTLQRPAFQYRITIKKDLFFQDDACFEANGGKGRRVTSDDFIFALKRIADPAVTCPVRAILGEKIAGLNDFYEANKELLREQKQHAQPARADYSLPVKGIRRIDDRRFEVSLTEKYPQFLYWLAMPFTAPIPQEAVSYYDSARHPDHPDFRDHPVGAGAYFIREYRKGQRIVLARNRNFRKELYPAEGEPEDQEAGLLANAGRELPLVDEWTFTIVKEPIPRWNLFKQGYLDGSSVPREAFDRVITTEGGLSEIMRRRGVKLYRAKRLTTYYFAFNMDDPLVGRNRKLRQAIASAIDTAEYLELFRNNMGVVAQSPLPPGLFGYDPHYGNSYRQADLAQARRLLAGAGYPKGIDPATGEPIEIKYDTSSTDASGRQETKWLVKQFEKINVKLNVIVNDWNTQQQKADDGNFQFIRYGWLADYPDPENFLFLLYSPNRRPGINYANYNNPQYDRLFEQMKSMSNGGKEGDERLALIREMIGILEEDCPWVPNFHPETFTLVHGWCGPTKLHGTAQNLLKYLDVDPEKRAAGRHEWNHPNYLAIALVLAVLVLASLPAVRSVRRSFDR